MRTSSAGAVIAGCLAHQGKLAHNFTTKLGLSKGDVSASDATSGSLAEAACQVNMPDAASHTLGSKVWVNDAVEGWVKGDVVKVEKGSLNVSTEKGSIKAYKPEDCPLQNPQTAGGVEVHGSAAAAPQTCSWQFAKAELALHAQKAFASSSLLKRAVSMPVMSADTLCPF